MTVRAPLPIAPPLQGGPLWGGVGGYPKEVIPSTCATADDGVESVLYLTLPRLLIWWGTPLSQQVFTTIADADGLGDLSLSIAGADPLPIYLNSAQASGTNIREGDFCSFGFDPDLGVDGGFHLLNWSQQGGSGASGNEIIVTTAGPFVVAASTSALILNKGAPTPTAVTLGSVAARNGLELVISDVGNNAGDITVTPAPGQTIMGFATYVIGSGGSATFKPNTDLSGWFKGN